MISQIFLSPTNDIRGFKKASRAPFDGATTLTMRLSTALLSVTSPAATVPVLGAKSIRTPIKPAAFVALFITRLPRCPMKLETRKQMEVGDFTRERKPAIVAFFTVSSRQPSLLRQHCDPLLQRHDQFGVPESVWLKTWIGWVNLLQLKRAIEQVCDPDVNEAVPRREPIPQRKVGDPCRRFGIKFVDGDERSALAHIR